METAFFWLSKIVWFAISPESVLLILVLAAWVALLSGALRWAKRLLGLAAAALFVLSLIPIGEWILFPLESRFPSNPPLPQKVNGIIVLGGAEDAMRSAAWGQVEVGDAAERLLASLELARRHPEAKILFTAGSGNLIDQKDKGSHVASRFYANHGLDPNRLVLEGESRNTAENVTRSSILVNPAKGEIWVLVTSASHMPRSVGIFCKAGWPVIPYPVDHQAVRGELLRISPSLVGNLGALSAGIKEWVGLAAYYVTGRTTTFFPAGCQS